MSSDQETHTGLRAAADKMQDALGGMKGRMDARGEGSYSADAFVENAAIGDIYEITAAEIALRRTRTDEIRQAAQKMIKDHTTSTHQLQSALRMNETAGVSEPPKEMDTRRLKMVEHLETAPDENFDKTYLDQQVLAHKETVDLMTGYRDQGDNAQLRSFARGTAPVVTRHLNHVEALRAEHG